MGSFPAGRAFSSRGLCECGLARAGHRILSSTAPRAHAQAVVCVHPIIPQSLVVHLLYPRQPSRGCDLRAENVAKACLMELTLSWVVEWT